MSSKICLSMFNKRKTNNTVKLKIVTLEPKLVFSGSLYCVNISEHFGADVFNLSPAN
jgi:hypothetical protein